jgi:MFS family permease
MIDKKTFASFCGRLLSDPVMKRMKFKEGVGNIFRALSHRNYRLYFTGQGISLVGTWMQAVALSWFLYRVSGSALLLGVAGFISQLPSLLLAPFAGVVADRFNRKKMLLVTQSLSMIQGFSLAALVFMGDENVVPVIALNFFLGIVTAFDAPLRQSFISELVEDRATLPNAIALNSAIFNATRLIGPSIGGILIAFTGEGTCFLINGLSYAAVLVALSFIRPVRIFHKTTERHSFSRDFRHGLSYAWHNIPIRYLIIQLSVMSLLGFSYVTLMPVIVRDVLGGGSHTMGFLMGGGGVGALVGALYLASRKSVKGLVRIIASTSMLVSVSLTGLAFSHNTYLCFILILLVGLGLILMIGGCNTILQTIVEERMRGRVMSLYTMSFMGIAPFGSLLMGGVSESYGVKIALLTGALSCFAGSIFFITKIPHIRRSIRSVYVKLGIVPVEQE